MYTYLIDPHPHWMFLERVGGRVERQKNVNERNISCLPLTYASTGTGTCNSWPLLGIEPS